MTDATDPGAALDLELKRLEVEKLRAEIDHVRLAWWKRPGYLAGLAPIVIAAAGVASAWASGYFDTRREELDARVAELDRVVAVLESQEAAAKSDLAEIAEREAAAKRQIAELASSERAIKQRMAEIQVQVETTYLQAKSALGEASYTLGHLEAYDGSVRLVTESIQTVKAEVPLLPSTIAGKLDQLVVDLNGIVQIRKDAVAELEQVAQTIDTVPVSDALRTLRYDPMAHSKGAMIFPDGRYYLIDSGRVLTPDAFNALP